MQISHSELTSYYRAARAALHFVEARRPGGRRFGPAADARWKAFAGGLDAAARLDLLIRDANAEWPGAFGARAVFSLDRVSEDDAFGAEWPGLDGVLAEELWRQAPPGAASSNTALEAVAESWGMQLAPFPIRSVDAAERIWAAGPSAIAALAQAFAGRRDLDWAVQVTCVATSPAHRQLAAFAAVVADGGKAATIVAGSAARKPTGVTVLASDDADPADRAALGG